VRKQERAKNKIREKEKKISGRVVIFFSNGEHASGKRPSTKFQKTYRHFEDSAVGPCIIIIIFSFFGATAAAAAAAESRFSHLLFFKSGVWKNGGDSTL